MTALVRGRVQRVGFRWWTRTRALELGLTGYVANRVDGRVLILARGSRQRLQELLDLLEGPEAPGRVDAVSVEWSDGGDPIDGFSAH